MINAPETTELRFTSSANTTYLPTCDAKKASKESANFFTIFLFLFSFFKSWAQLLCADQLKDWVRAAVICSDDSGYKYVGN